MNEIVNNIYYYLNGEYFGEWLKDLCTTYSLVEKMPEEYKDHIFDNSILPKAKHLLGASLEAAIDSFNYKFIDMENFDYVDNLCRKNGYASVNWNDLSVKDMKILLDQMQSGIMDDDKILEFVNLRASAKKSKIDF